jgi:hypothetical protein
MTNVVEEHPCGLAAGLEAGDHALCSLESRHVDEDDVLLFRGIEKISTHEISSG